MLLFAGRNEAEILLIIQDMLGPMPSHLLNRSSNVSAFYDDNQQLILPKDKVRRGRKAKSLARALNVKEDSVFLSFVAGCLQLDPDERLTAAEALRHPFFQGLDSFSGKSDLFDFK